jgi:hypothetical protein
VVRQFPMRSSAYAFTLSTASPVRINTRSYTSSSLDGVFSQKIANANWRSLIEEDQH